MKMIRTFLFSLTTLVLAVLYVGMILSALISFLAGILRTIGFRQIKMSLWYGIDLPVAFSIPLSLIVSIILIVGSMYVKRSIKFCVSNIRL